MLVKVICDILLYHSSWLLLLTPLHIHQLILWFYQSQFPDQMYLPTTTFRATFLQLQAMVLILIQPDRSLFSHLQLILLLPVCATAMGTAGFQPSRSPHICPQDRTPFQPPRLPQHCQAFPSLACACPHPCGAGAAPVPCPCPAAGCGLGWDRLPDPAWLLLAVAHKTHSVS